MKLHLTLLAASALLALLCPTAVQADDGILSFELSPPQWVEPPPIAEAVAPAVDNANQPLPIPAQAANPPMRYHSPQQLPAGVYQRGVAVGLNESTSATALLPPAPPLSMAPVMVAAAPEPVAPEPKVEPPKETQRLALDFGLEPSAAVIMAQAKLSEPKATPNPLLGLFEGNSDSLVARAVGSAEGTRTPNGAINPAYFGHTDPGNRVWNMGTFSYQHGAQTPEEADQKQLARLQNQGDVLRQRALKHGLNLTLEETLNGLDLANQSPLAAIGQVGYIERLAEAKANGYEGSEAILVARTRSYINPNTGRWNAPGLGNTEAGIRRDQQRRASAVAQAIAAYETQNPDLHPQTWVLTPAPEPESLVALNSSEAEPVDEVLQMWTSPSDPVAQIEPTNEAVAASPNPAEASDTDPLAALWQVTVERFSQAAFPSGAGTSPQTASLANALFNRGNGSATTTAVPDHDEATAPPPASVASSDSAPSADETSPTPIPAAATDSGAQELGTDLVPSAAAPPAETVAEPAAIAPPSWADAREGSQSVVPITTTSPVPGAFPDSTIYMPQATVAEPDAQPATAPQEDPVSPATEVTANPEAEPPEAPDALNTSAAPLAVLEAEPTAVPADAASTPEPEKPLGFEQVSSDDLSLRTSPTNVEPLEPEAIALPDAEPSQVITPDAAREGASAQ
ncbi:MULTISPECIES: hypothetical protein [Cyanophyceae]|uniref:Uncharacterized protein n=1 Tax=Leptolyngbya subtilissima DQ-A4 TaxID=2933933 RepID=A0ABV0K567_9CYAN|nr:hypothetical protein [Nodosilinea sp. FACHB-141]MBD2112770.1 hypothetical protein [Nodosilinea sp. FACHB-141]